MMDSLFLAGFDPLHEVPEQCTICSSRPPVFCFDYRGWDEKQNPQESKGFCCTSCAISLVKQLDRAESQEWESEEAALAADDFDVTEFHKHRLAAFPTGNGHG